MSERYETVAESLVWEPEPLGFNRETIKQQTYDTLCDMVDLNEITLQQANAMYELWKQDFGYLQ